MKNRLFPIIIGLCFVSLVGLAFLRTPNPQTEAPIETESVQESVTPSDRCPKPRTQPVHTELMQPLKHPCQA